MTPNLLQQQQQQQQRLIMTTNLKQTDCGGRGVSCRNE
jgi:hypothetical protein